MDIPIISNFHFTLFLGHPERNSIETTNNSYKPSISNIKFNHNLKDHSTSEMLTWPKIIWLKTKVAIKKSLYLKGTRRRTSIIRYITVPPWVKIIMGIPYLGNYEPPSYDISLSCKQIWKLFSWKINNFSQNNFLKSSMLDSQFFFIPFLLPSRIGLFESFQHLDIVV